MKAVTSANGERLEGVRRAIALDQLAMQESDERLGYWLDRFADIDQPETIAPKTSPPTERSTTKQRPKAGATPPVSK